MDLKQSTTVTVVIGPFLNATDGVTPLPALSLTSADIRLSKNGAAFAAKNDATAPIHLENGYYSCVMNATDTGTLGDLELAVFATGAVPEFRTYGVMSASAYALLYETDGQARIQLRSLSLLGGSGVTPLVIDAGVGGAPAANAISIIGDASTPVVSTRNFGAGAASKLLSDLGIALDVDGNGGPAARFQGSTKGIEVTGETAEGIDINAAGVGLDITSTGADGANISGTTNGLAVSGATGKDLDAKEIDAIGTDVDAIVAKLPAGTISDLALTDQVDGVTLFNIYELTMAMINGRYEIDNPSAGKITFFKRDSVSILTTVTVGATNRTRDV